ncbi:MAG TPA: TldD/PmbA family protein [Pseudothermotoga sp.]|nr:TldD/PmbA family protein [Pseudothermotoga sp.]HOK83805.1 TldD/PmbA family protein [Pseudothermotoga sp.]HPP70291.1 TldD/PmbA family protein [Pseudothermotoga sp.]
MKGENFYRNLFRLMNEHFVGLKFLSSVSNNEGALTRFANSEIHQNVFEKKSVISILATKDNKVAVATTNDLSINGLKEARKKLEQMLENSTPLDYEFRLPDVSIGYPVENISDSVKNASAEDRAQIFDKILKVSGKDVQAFGYVSDSISENAVISSNGMFVYQAYSSASFNFVALSGSGSGYVSSTARGYEDLDVDKKIHRAIEFAKRSNNQVEIDPGLYTVILGPEAVSELFFYFSYVCTNGYMHELKMSPSVRFLGQKIGPSNLNVYDDPNHKMQVPWVYDICGKKREKTAIIENGVFKNVFYSHGASLRFGKKPTGHSISLEDLDFSMPANLVIEGGTTPVEEIISHTERGIYVNRFHYMNVVDPYEAMFTGMTRDGTFLIENGQLTRPIKNMRFNVKFFEFSKNIEAISKETESTSGEYFPAVAPFIKVSNFNFTSKTA